MSATPEAVVSVVVPVYNGERYVAEALASVLNQGPELLEVVVMDNASTDRTSDIVTAIGDTRIRYERQEVLVPVWQNWSDACSLVRGAFTKVVCADDRLLPQALATQVRLLTKFPSAAGACGARNVITDSGRPFPLPSGSREAGGLRQWSDVLRASIRSGGNTVGEPACVLFRTDIVKSRLPWSEEWSFLMDLEMYARAFNGEHVTISNDPLAEFRLATGSWSQQLRGKQAQEYIRWVRSIKDRDLINLSADDLQCAERAAQRRERQREVAYVLARGIERCPAGVVSLMSRK